VSNVPAIHITSAQPEVTRTPEAYSLNRAIWASGVEKSGEAYCWCSLHPAKYPWVHEQMFKTFDHQA